MGGDWYFADGMDDAFGSSFGGGGGFGEAFGGGSNAFGGGGGGGGARSGGGRGSRGEFEFRARDPMELFEVRTFVVACFSGYVCVLLYCMCCCRCFGGFRGLGEAFLVGGGRGGGVVFKRGGVGVLECTCI